MSGILAVATLDGTTLPAETAQIMGTAAPHLGPVHAWSGAGVVIASLGSPESLRVEDDIVVALDARFDNRRELAHDLGISGTRSDACLLLEAYRRWGAASISRLIGDFALVIWDTHARRMLAARDVMGVRNVYYRAVDRRRVLIATELKQLLAVRDTPCRPNQDAILADLAGLYALPHMTAYEDILRIPPAHALTLDANQNRVERYWSPDYERRIQHKSEAEYAEELLHILAEAVRSRSTAQRGRTGILISGDIDSTSVLSSATWLREREEVDELDVHAYAWAFDDLTDCDERSVIRPIADHARIPLWEIPADDAWPLGSGHAPDRDDPFSAIYQRLFDRSFASARDAGCSTFLTTDRGNDLMGSWVYDDLGVLAAAHLGDLAEDARAYRRRHNATTAKYVVARLLKPLFTTLWPPGSMQGLRSHLPGKVRSKPPPPWIPTAHVERTAEMMRAASDVAPVRGHARLNRHAAVFNYMSRRIGEERQRSSARYGLVHADPWADRRLVDFALAVPQWRLHRYGREKSLIRSAMRGLMPESVRRRVKPVTAPVALYSRGFVEREVGTVRMLFKESRAAEHGWLDADQVLAAYDAFLRGDSLEHNFWFPITVEMWLRAWWE